MCTHEHSNTQRGRWGHLQAHHHQRDLFFKSAWYSYHIPWSSPLSLRGLVSHPPPQTSASTSDLSRGPHLPLRREIAVFRQNFPARPSQALGHTTASHPPPRLPLFQPRSQGSPQSVLAMDGFWNLPSFSPPVVSPGFRNTNPQRSPSSSPVAAPPPYSSSPAKCLERLGSTSVLYFTPPTPSSAPLGYGFLPQPWEAVLHSAQAGGWGWGNRLPLWRHFPLTLGTSLSLGFSDPIFLAFLIIPRSPLLTHVSCLHL